MVLQCEAITDIDVTAAGMLERLDEELNADGVHLAFAELRSRLRDLVHDYGLHPTLDRDHFYDSIDDAFAAIDPTGTKGRPNREPHPDRPTHVSDRAITRGGSWFTAPA